MMNVTGEKKDEGQLYSQLEVELRKGMQNKEAIFQLMELTQESRRTAMENIERSVDVTFAVLEKFPSLNKETTGEYTIIVKQ